MKAYHIIVAMFTALFFACAVSMALPVNPLWIASGIMALFIAQLAGIYLLGGQRAKGLLLMALTAYAPCTVALGTYTPAGDCIDEGSGILGLLLVKKGFDLTTIIDVTTYGAAKTAKNLIVVKDIEAYWPKASQVTIPGIAGRIERHGHFEYEMPFKAEGVDANLIWWNTINQNKNFGIIFITEEYKAFTPLDRNLLPVLCLIKAVPMSDGEFGKTRYIDGLVKWKHKDLVMPVDLLTVPILKTDFEP